MQVGRPCLQNRKSLCSVYLRYRLEWGAVRSRSLRFVLIASALIVPKENSHQSHNIDYIASITIINLKHEPQNDDVREPRRDCGGGGGGSSTPPPVVTPPPPIVSTPPPYILMPATLEATAVAGYSTNVELIAKQAVPFVGIAYLKIVPDANVIDPAIVVTPQPDGTFVVHVKTASTVSAGHYSGNFTISVCADANCASHLSGSPFKLPYNIDVIPPEGGVTAYNQPALSALAGVPDWETFQANARHTGYVPVSLNYAQFSPRWKWQAPSVKGRQVVPSTIATGGGRIYVSNGQFFDSAGISITAYNESDGSKAWSHSFQDLTYPSTNPPAFSNGRVFISAGSQQSTAMFGFDAASGAQLFKSAMTSQWPRYLAPTVFNGNVYSNGGSYGGLYSFVAATGELNFFKQLAQYDGWTPAIDAQNLYTYVGGALHMIDPVTGVVRGSIADPTYDWNGYTTGGAPVIGAAGTVFAGNLSNSTDNAIAAFDTLAKSVRWTARGAYPGNPAYVDGLLFAINNVTARLEVHKESDGTVAWNWTMPSGDQKFVGDVLVTNNLVFLSTTRTTYAIDRTSHAAVWSYKASGNLAMSANGVLYIKGKSTIVAINLK